ncbi:hypothetical protein Hanom_Chr02g00149481 [Helianthus anomalus]
MVEPPFYIAEKVKSLEIALRGGLFLLLLTEAIEAEDIQRPKTVQDYMKIARRLKTKFT